MNLLLRSGWQTENIGDIAHMPGLLALIGRRLPQARLRYTPYHKMRKANWTAEEFARREAPPGAPSRLLDRRLSGFNVQAPGGRARAAASGAYGWLSSQRITPRP